MYKYTYVFSLVTTVHCKFMTKKFANHVEMERLRRRLSHIEIIGTL